MDWAFFSQVKRVAEKEPRGRRIALESLGLFFLRTIQKLSSGIAIFRIAAPGGCLFPSGKKCDIIMFRAYWIGLRLSEAKRGLTDYARVGYNDG